jgi:hypothetical protein
VRSIRATSCGNGKIMIVRIAVDPSGTRAGFVIAAASVFATAATVSVAIVARRRLRRNVRNNVKGDAVCSKDPDDRRYISSATDFSSLGGDNNLGPKSQPVKSTANLAAAHNHYLVHAQFTVEERRQALAHVKARVVQLRTLHEIEGLERHHTAAYHSRRVYDECLPVDHKFPFSKICWNDEIRAVDLVPAAKRPSLLQKDSDEGTESTDFSDFCSTSSLLDISFTVAALPDCNSSATDTEKANRVLHSPFLLLCSEALALVGCIAGTITIAHV